MFKRVYVLLFTMLLMVPLKIFSQTYDTISNWDGFTQNWQVVAGSGSGVVSNPSSGGINLSDNCFRIITTTSQLDYIYYNLTQHPDFDQFPYYNLKILAPPQGGSVLLKFENNNASDAQEIKLTPTPGQWTNLMFDFSGRPYVNYTRMVIFVDFQGTVAGRAWYVDDVTKTIPAPINLHSTLPIVVINSFGTYIPDEPKIPAHMGVIDNGPGSLNSSGDPFNQYDGHIGIEVRGQSSQMFPKKAYAVETRDSTGANLNVPLLGMPAENDWVFYAPYTDKSMLRNVVTFFIAEKLSGYNTRTRFCELIVNNNYKGVYVMMEKIKKDSNRVDIATLNPDEITGDDVTGGYIVKVDKIEAGFSYGVNGWRSTVSPPYSSAAAIVFQHEYPDYQFIVQQQRDYIRNFITNGEKALTSTSFKDPDKGYQKYFDVSSFIDYMLVCEISKEVDKFRYSTYFFKDKDSNGGKLCAGPGWDYDLGYGNVDYWSPGIDYTGMLYPMTKPFGNDWIYWWKKMMEDTYFRDFAKTRWTEVRQTVLTDSVITAAIDSMVNLLGPAIDRNFERWPILGQYVWPNYNWKNNDYEDELAHFKTFLFNRLHWMDSFFPGNILHSWSSITPKGSRIILDLYGDYFCRPQLKTSHFQLNDAPAGMQIAEVEYVSSSQCLLTLSGIPGGYPGISVTVEKKILNGHHDLISNKLSAAGIDIKAEKPVISMFMEHDQLHIRCNRPAELPDRVEIFNVAGQRIGDFPIERQTENLLSVRLSPGIYLVAFRMDSGIQVERVVVF